MADPIADLSHEEFIIFLPSGVLTHDEIAEKIRSYERPSAKEKLEIVEAVQKLFRGGPVTGSIRTAIRALDGLPPVPEDLRSERREKTAD